MGVHRRYGARNGDGFALSAAHGQLGVSRALLVFDAAAIAMLVIVSYRKTEGEWRWRWGDR
jgi:hypothetical protein